MRKHLSLLGWLILAAVVSLLSPLHLFAQTLPGVSDASSRTPSTSGPYGYNSFTLAPCASFVDPDLGGTVKRISSDRQADDIYSKNMWINADATKMIHGGKVIDLNTCAVTHNVNRGNPSSDSGFDPVDPNVYYYISGSTIKKVTLGAGGLTTESTLYQGSGTIGGLGGSVNWISADGSLFLVNVGGSIKVIDRATGQPYSGSVPNNYGGGYVGIFPSGNHVYGIFGGDAKSWRLDKVNKTIGAPNIFWQNMCGDHNGFLSSSTGVDYGVMQECNQQDGIWRVPVDADASGKSWQQQIAMPGVKELLAPMVRWQNGKHFSTVARGPLQDWAFISMECDDTPCDPFNSTPSNWPAFRQEIVAVNVLTGEWRRVAHHRSRGIGSDYSYQPRLTSSWGGEYVCWASNFNASGGVDLYCSPFAPSGPDTTPPVVTIFAPATATVNTPVTFTMSVNEPTSSQSFSIDGQTITSPQTFTAIGQVSLKATAVDVAGNASSTTTVINVVAAAPQDTTPPTVTIVKPTSGSSIVAGTPTTLTASVTDNVDPPSGAVVWKVGTTIVTSPYNFPVAGNVTLSATATDAAGNSSTTSVPLLITPATTPTPVDCVVHWTATVPSTASSTSGATATATVRRVVDVAPANGGKPCPLTVTLTIK